MFNPEDYRNANEFVIPNKDEWADRLADHISLELLPVPGHPDTYFTAGFTDEFVIVVRPNISTEENLDFCLVNSSRDNFLRMVEEEESWGEHYKLPIVTGSFAYSILRELQYADHA